MAKQTKGKRKAREKRVKPVKKKTVAVKRNDTQSRRSATKRAEVRNEKRFCADRGERNGLGERVRSEKNGCVK